MIAFAAAFIFLLLDILHLFKLPQEGLLIVVTIYIITLVADRLKEGEQVRENTEKLTFISNSLFGKGAALRRRPTTPEEYDYLWRGYTGKCYVYNPSYRVDKNTGKEEFVKILIRRYQNPHFRTRALSVPHQGR